MQQTAAISGQPIATAGFTTVQLITTVTAMNSAILRSSGRLFAFLLALLSGASTYASEADVKIPNLNTVQFQLFGSNVSGVTLLYIGLVICVLGVEFGLMQYAQTNALEVHSSMQIGRAHV